MSTYAVPTAPSLRDLAFRRVDQVVLGEIERARPRVKRLRRRYPEAAERELVQRLVDQKLAYAGTGGLVTGLFGLVALPADLVLVTYLQVSVIVEVAVLHGVNLKSRRGQAEVLDILARGNGVGPLVRAGPPVLGRLAISLFARRGLPALGRAVPLIAGPVSAWLNNRDIQRVGDEALRHYGSLRRLEARRVQPT